MGAAALSAEDPGSASSRQTAAPELHRVCLHEYAHLVVARHYGAAGFVRIRRLPVPSKGVCYSGAFQMHGDPGERAWRVVALAGTLAEWLADAPTLDAATAHVRLQAAPDALSAVDARLAAGFDAADVHECIALLRELWPAIVQEAEEHTAAAGADRDAGAAATPVG